MSSKIVIPIALVAVGAGMYGVSQDYLSQQQANTVKVETVAPKPVEIKTVSVWVAKTPIAAKQLLDAELFELVTVPETEAIAKGIDPTKPFVISRTWIARTAIAEGEWLVNASYVTPASTDYIDYALGENMVPYPLDVHALTTIGGAIKSGSLVDIIAITKQEAHEGAYRINSVNIQPILAAKKILKVERVEETYREDGQVTVLLELTRKEVATLSIAKTIAKLEIHLSSGVEQAAQLQANSGDVLPQFKAIAEYRGANLAIK
jgi:pilus assembly protein CpaB